MKTITKNNRYLWLTLGLFMTGFSTCYATTGAVYTTRDNTNSCPDVDNYPNGGCLDNPTGVNCNNYEKRANVFLSGGPAAGNSGLAPGDYFFTVLVPGFQNGGFLFDTEGNLSDTVIGGDADNTPGAPIGDEDNLYSDHVFTIKSDGTISYTGDHCAQTIDGKKLIQLMPYDLTPNSGGVYILAVCEVGTTSPSACKYDAFRVNEGVAPPEENPPVISGLKYYDLNTDGQWNVGEVGIGNWPIQYTDASNDIFNILTIGDGTFMVSPPEGSYTFSEVQGVNPWVQTGNLVNQSVVQGDGSVTLNVDKSYSVVALNDDVISGLNFGNVCLGQGGGKTLGFWSNKNGAKLIGADDLLMLRNLHLRNENGTAFDPSTISELSAWLLSARAVNMANMLSAQLAAMSLNVYNGLVAGDALIYAPGTSSANANGFASVNAIIVEADKSLEDYGNTPSGDPNRAIQEALKNALDNANNNRNFVQGGPENCPLPPVAP